MSGFFAMISRIKYINRWGLMRCWRNETLSEHTLEVAMLTHALIEIANSVYSQGLDAGTGVLIAMYHDCSEIITGDLPTPVKYHDDDIKSAYKAIERQAKERLLSMLPNELKAGYRPYLVEEGGLFELYSPYVKAADKLSALIKCTEELSAGNREFQKAYRATLEHPALELREARLFMEKYLPAYSLPLDEVESYGQDNR